MTALLDTRPPGLDLKFRPGTTLTLTLNWPAGSLVGRTFTSTLDGTSLSLNIVSNTMTVTVTDTQTTAITSPATWLLLESIGGTPEPIIIGTWAPSTSAADVSQQTVQVTQGAATVDIDATTVTSLGNLTVGGDLSVGGLITLGDGITNEGRSFSSNEMFTTASRIVTNNLPRIVLPNSAITSVFIGPVGLSTWWPARGLTIGFDCVNDHSASGNVVWRVILRKFNSFGSATTPTISLDSTVTAGAPGANGGMATIANAAWTNVNITADLFGSLYCAEIRRVATDAADTVEGPMAITEVVFARGTL